ncbi:MAG: RNA-binding domain-containing protein [Vulcanibacillus sp.]
MKINDLFKGLIFETDIYEFKKNLNPKEDKRWLKTICGFSNSKGGHIYIGVNNDDNELFTFNQKEIDVIKQTINNGIFSNITPIPKYEITTIEVSDKYIVDLTIYKNEYGITFFKDAQNGNQIYVRRNGQTTFAIPEEILKMALNIKKYEYDKTVIGIRSNDTTFTIFNEEYMKSNNGESVTNKLQKSLGLISQDGYLTLAGLLFSDYNQYENGNIVVTVWPGDTKGSKTYIDSKKHTGNIIFLLHKAIENIQNVPYYMFGGQKTDLRRQDIGSFSYLSLREAIVNALAHRDYTIDGNEIAIDCFKDRIEISSPGSMLHGTTIGYQRLDENTVSQRRNSIICHTLEKLKLMENKGSGFANIISDYRDLGDSYTPLFKSTDVSFTIRLANKKFISTVKNQTTPLTTSKNYLNNINLFKSRQELFLENPNNEIIVEMIENDKNTDYEMISSKLGITRDGAKYYIKKLRDSALIRREGSNRYGYYETYQELDRPSDFMNLDDETRRKVLAWCEKYFVPSQSIYLDMSSYGLKHILEKDTDIYLTNGQFKGAMILSGFIPKSIDELNWYFNISKKSPAIYMGKKA